MSNFSITSAARSISRKYGVKVSPRWYRSLCAKGVGQSHRRTEAKLQAIADFFGVRVLNHLWKPDLIMFRLDYDFVPPTHAEYTARFAQLLESGNHDYLRAMVMKLYDLEYPDSPIGSPSQSRDGNDDCYFTPKYIDIGGVVPIDGKWRRDEEAGDDVRHQEAD